MIKLSTSLIGWNVRLKIGGKRCGVIYREDDGKFVFEPTHFHAWESKLLRSIAERLDRLNSE